MKTIWILTEAYNLYDQQGNYMISAFINKPSISDLITLLKCDKTSAIHILNGGGRIGVEENWYYLTELKEGTLYESKY